jgi:hypothetical protein
MGRLTVSGAAEIDVATGASAMVGLILVFLVLIGVISSSFASYQTAEQKAALIRYQRRAGFAFAGFVLALLSTLLALNVRWHAWEWAAEASLVLVFVALIVGLFRCQGIV